MLLKIGKVLAAFGLGLVIFGFGASRCQKESVKAGEVTVVTPLEEDDTAIEAKVYPILKIEAAAGQVILLNTQVDVIIEQMQAAKSSFSRLFLVISSPGGSVISGAKLIAYMESSDIEIDTVCVELCASMAYHIFEAGKVRFVVNRSFLMGHNASGAASGTLPNMISMLTSVQKMVSRLDAKAARRAGIPYPRYELMQLKNMWLEAPDAVTLGLADKIVHFTYNSRGSAFNTADELVKRGITIKNNPYLLPVYEIK